MPDLTPPAAGLRRLWNNSKQAAKVQVQIPPGDVFEVSEELAEQLQSADPHLQPAPQLAIVVTDPPAVAEIVAEVDKVARRGRAR